MPFIPSRTDYDDAIIAPKHRLKIPDPNREYKEGSVEMMEMKTTKGQSYRMPYGMQGGFAVVYKFRTKSKKLRALRVFTNPNLGDTEDRYEAIGPFLKAHAAEVAVDFNYHDQGITLKDTQGDSHIYPLIDMEWVEGETLIDKVNDLCRQGDRNALDQLGRRWIELLNILRAARMAHGDLSGDNVMIRPDGKLALVDYDGIYIPAFNGQQAYTIGQPDYQHPDMAKRPFNEWMDEFSWLAIHAALQALRVKPELWKELVDYGGNGKLLNSNILFEAKDYKDPGQSQVFSRLRQIREPNVAQAVEALAAACKMNIEQVRVPQALIFSEKTALERLQKALEGKDHRAVRDAWPSNLDNYAPAQKFKPQVQIARDHLKKLEEFGKAAVADNDEELANIWQKAPDLTNCACACAATEKLSGGATVLKRAGLALKRAKGIQVVRSAIQAAEQKKQATGLYQEAEELAIESAWDTKEFDLASSKVAKDKLQPRVEEARIRRAVYSGFNSLKDDEQTAKDWLIICTYAPADRKLKDKAETALARLKILQAFIAQMELDDTDEQKLWRIWSERKDMNQCAPAAKPMAKPKSLKGIIPSERAELANQRSAALKVLQGVFDQHNSPPLTEAGEKKLREAWDGSQAILGNHPAGVKYKDRAEQARLRLKVWDAFKRGIELDDDKPIAENHHSGMVSDFLSDTQRMRAKESTERMAVVAALERCHKANPEDEAGLSSMVPQASDSHMAKCKSFTTPAPGLNGQTWQQRITRARQILTIRVELDAILAAKPLPYDRIPSVWNEALCRNHRLFSADLGRINQVVELGIQLHELRQGLKTGDDKRVCSGWRAEFRDLMEKENQLGAIREAMRRHFTGANCLANLELSLAGGELSVRWEWREGVSHCFVAVRDGNYPEPRAGTGPNCSRKEVTGGQFNTSFSGHSPHVRIWPMFRLADEFVLGAIPLERRLATVEYNVTKPMFRKHRLTLTPLSGKIKLPELAVIISENPLWPDAQEGQTIPGMDLIEPHTLELMLPPTLAHGKELYLSLRPVDRSHEGWLGLKPKSAGADKICL